jgi:hypothetical protein
MVLTKKQFMALTPAQRAQMMTPQKKSRKRPARKRATRNTNPIVAGSKTSARNGSGRKPGQRRQRGGVTTTAGNTRSFIIPIDEDVGDMVGSTLFSYCGLSLPYTLGINPGNPYLFPFASKIAQNYERYEFESLRFEFRPSVGMYAVQGQQGMVGISATMDAAQTPPSTQPQADTMYHSPVVETAKPTSLSLPKSFMQSKSIREKFFVRQSGLIPGGASPHDYDCGLIFPWTNGQINTNKIGILRVVGKCRLMNPQSSASTNAPVNNCVSLFSCVNLIAGASGVTNLFPLGSVTQINPLGITFVVSNNGTLFTLPAGNYNIDFVGDADQSVVSAGIILTCGIQINGANVSPYITNTSYPSSAVIGHAASSLTWFVSSNGTTTVGVAYVATYPSGAPNLDGMIRFTAI